MTVTTSGIFLIRHHIHKVYMQEAAICNAFAPFSVQYANEMKLKSCHCSSFLIGELGGPKGPKLVLSMKIGPLD